LRRRAVLKWGAALTLAPLGARSRASPGRATQISIFHYQEGGRAAVFKEIVTRFERENPFIQVNSVFRSAATIQADMQAALAARQPLDLGTVVGSRVRAFMQSLPVAPINSEPGQSGFLQRILPNFLDAGRKGEQLYAVPYALGTPLLYFNKTLLRQAGLDPERPPTTMDELIAVGRSVQDRTGAAGFGHVGGIDHKFFGTALIVRNAGGRYLNEAGTRVVLDSPEAIKALQLWQDLAVKYRIMPLVADDAGWRTAFLTGKLGQYVDSSALLGDAIAAAHGKFELGATYYPLFPGRTRRSVVNSGALFMMFSPPGPRREAALRFLEFITRLDVQGFWAAATGYMPVVRDPMRDPQLQSFIGKTPQAAAMIAQMPFTQAVDGWTNPKNPAAESIVGKLIDDLWAGKRPAAELVPEAVRSANAALV
jgi:ABC-type glycerol-3-phosphate transport system substrate-binding protein